MWQCEWWCLYKTDALVKNHLQDNFRHKRPVSVEKLWHGIIDGKLFAYVEYDIDFPEHLGRYFSNFPPIFKNTVVSREDFGTLMWEYAEKENDTAHPKKMLISSFHLTHGTLITHVTFVLLEACVGLQRTSKLHIIRSHKAFQHLRTKYRISDNGLQPTHCVEVFKWWRITECNK